VRVLEAKKQKQQKQKKTKTPKAPKTHMNPPSAKNAWEREKTANSAFPTHPGYLCTKKLQHNQHRRWKPLPKKTTPA
jgi:hypothetical protein